MCTSDQAGQGFVKKNNSTAKPISWTVGENTYKTIHIYYIVHNTKGNLLGISFGIEYTT